MKNKKLLAVISKNPSAQMKYESEIVETIDITPCREVLSKLFKIANIIEKKPENFDNTAQFMAQMLRMVEQAIRWENADEKE